MIPEEETDDEEDSEDEDQVDNGLSRRGERQAPVQSP